MDSLFLLKLGKPRPRQDLQISDVTKESTLQQNFSFNDSQYSKRNVWANIGYTTLLVYVILSVSTNIPPILMAACTY